MAHDCVQVPCASAHTMHAIHDPSVALHAVQDAARLFDLFLASHPLMPLYLGAVAMKAARRSLLACTVRWGLGSSSGATSILCAHMLYVFSCLLSYGLYNPVQSNHSRS